MQQALINFYYQFHTKQHYFLCHDILEDAWKAENNYSKQDAVVSLILFATACYHYRRNNLKGAYKSFNKSKEIIQNAKDRDVLYLNLNDYQLLIEQQIAKLNAAKPFSSVILPITPDFERIIKANYPDFERIIKANYPDYDYNQETSTDPFIVDHHMRRDRSEVISAKEEAIQLRKHRRN
ncbi:DUF309 domain-containing protein [Staphylococcus aureus]|nr:DUF309 domain-containing protein [Staphylococcus aureus]